MKQCNGMSLSKIEIYLPKKSQNFVTAPRIVEGGVAPLANILLPVWSLSKKEKRFPKLT